MFDPSNVPLAWFDEEASRLGWFDPDLLLRYSGGVAYNSAHAATATGGSSQSSVLVLPSAITLSLIHI